MSISPFLIINEHPISIQQALGYLKGAGKLQEFMLTIVRQYVIEQVLKDSKIMISPLTVEQAAINFRLQQKLADPQVFEQWLTQNNLTYEQLHEQIANGLKLARLKAEIADPHLTDYFNQHQARLNRVILSRLVVEEKQQAEELYQRLQGGANFAEMARQYSMTEDRWLKGMMGPVSLDSIPEAVRESVQQAREGEVLPPVFLDNRWVLLQVEQFLPATLERPDVRELLQNEIFERWLGEKIQALSVKVGSG